jgi:hypothetical protein
VPQRKSPPSEGVFKQIKSKMQHLKHSFQRKRKKPVLVSSSLTSIPDYYERDALVAYENELASYTKKDQELQDFPY